MVVELDLPGSHPGGGGSAGRDRVFGGGLRSPFLCGPGPDRDPPERQRRLRRPRARRLRPDHAQGALSFLGGRHRDAGGIGKSDLGLLPGDDLCRSGPSLRRRLRARTARSRPARGGGVRQNGRSTSRSTRSRAPRRRSRSTSTGRFAAGPRRVGETGRRRLTPTRGRGRSPPTAPAPQVLRLHLTAVPGWHATIDGRPLRLDQFSGAMLQARIPAGRHTVELRYWPGTFSVGLGLALASAVTLSVALGVSHRRRRLELGPADRPPTGRARSLVHPPVSPIAADGRPVTSDGGTGSSSKSTAP